MSRRVHSRYERRLLDLSVGGRETVIQLQVRRFACRQSTCQRKTFVEQVEDVTAAYARQTDPARRMLESVGLAVGGRAGARLGDRLALPAGRMTLLRLIRRLPDPAHATPRVLGVDDFALRRGHRYGTILIDVETGEAIDVLADRTAETFAAWLRAHPGVEIVCRDRGGSYAEGAAQGAPDAIQVADRWHLIHNLSQAVEKAVAALRRLLQPVPVHEGPNDEPLPPDDSAPAPSPAPEPKVDGPLAQRTRARHAEVHALVAQGLGIHAIARRLNFDPQTVHRYADAADVNDLLGPGRAGFRYSMLDSFTPYLLNRCAEGVTATTLLFNEIKARGYTGGSRTLRRWLVGVRGDEPQPVTPPPPPSTRDITGLIMRPAAKLTDDQTTTLERLCQQCPQLGTVRDLAHGFATLIRNRSIAANNRLDAWTAQVNEAAIPHLISFARGLGRDRDAVIAGLSLSWSSGRVEGTVNKIKMLKRQMFGRANTDLLRKRILLAQ